jgi:hypothetical protein
MNVAEAMAHHPRLAAPREDGGILMAPPWRELPTRLATNIGFHASASVDVQGRDLLALSRQARRELLAAAFAYTRQYRNVAISPQQARGAGEGSENSAGPILLAGHQPQLFHPGVWAKNFVLGRLAAEQGGMAVNLLIDSDAVRSTSSRVPGGSLHQPTLASVPFDVPPDPGIAYEECAIQDQELLASFGARAAEVIAPLVPAPLLTEYWPLVIERAQATGNIGLALAQSRHQLEGQWGCETLELPQSHCCRGEAFHYFASHLLAHLPRLWDIYNSSLSEYRKAQRIRSAAHPVPDLAAEDDWLEAPFWVWTADEPRRRPLFVRSSGGGLDLSDRVGGHWQLEAFPESDGERAAAQLADLARGGLRLRTRALLTTMYARLVLSDLFIHGIGGSKYDELTDLLIERFFGLTPPGYATLSATVRLPVPHADVDAASIGRLEHQIRAVAHHPEVVLERRDGASTTADGARALLERKRSWLATDVTPESAPVRHRELGEINRALWPWVADEAASLERRRDQLRQSLPSTKILTSREYDFCLYPAEMLRRFMCEELPRRLLDHQ